MRKIDSINKLKEEKNLIDVPEISTPLKTYHVKNLLTRLIARQFGEIIFDFSKGEKK